MTMGEPRVFGTPLLLTLPVDASANAVWAACVRQARMWLPRTLGGTGDANDADADRGDDKGDDDEAAQAAVDAVLACSDKELPFRVRVRDRNGQVCTMNSVLVSMLLLIIIFIIRPCATSCVVPPLTPVVLQCSISHSDAVRARAPRALVARLRARATTTARLV